MILELGLELGTFHLFTINVEFLTINNNNNNNYYYLGTQMTKFKYKTI
jgi:hypothetical protein